MLFLKKYMRVLFFNKKSKSSKGFTLVELLVVIAIIGLLASIILVSLQGPRATARDTKRRGDIRQIQTAMELCYGDSACGEGAEAYLFSTTYPAAIGTYIPVMPDDPQATGYSWLDNLTPDDNQEYCVFADLEDGGYIVAAHSGYYEKSTTPTGISGGLATDCDSPSD